jgi:hypothetical protein
MRRLVRALGVLMMALLVALVLPAAGIAQQGSRSVNWQRFDVDLDIQPNGSLNVTETQAILFNGTFQSGYRIVPLDRTTGVTDVTVAEIVGDRTIAYSPGGGSRANTFSSSVGQDGLTIDWSFPQTTNSVRTFVLRYVVSGAVRIYENGDQLQWQAIYATDRAGPITNSSVTVHLPADVAATDLQSAWYQLPAGRSLGALSPAGSGTRIDARTVRFNTGLLAPRVGAEVRVQFPHGLLPSAAPLWQVEADRSDALVQSVAPIGNFLALLLSLAIAAGGTAFLIVQWRSHGRDPRVGNVPSRLREPPSELPAPLAGTLVDEFAGRREAVAALVDIAERGLVRLKDEQNPRLVGSHTDVRITLDAPIDDAQLRGYERELLSGLFGPRPDLPAEVLLSDVKQQFQATIPRIQDQLYEAISRAGLFVRNPETTRRIWYAIGFTLLAVGIIFAIGAGALLGRIVGLAWLPGVAVATIGGVGAAMAVGMPRRTQTGALEAAKWRAFEAYLKEALRTFTPGMALPPHYLPYAVAFGVDEAYVRHLESVGTPPPRWYNAGPWPTGPGGVVIVPGGWHGHHGSNGRAAVDQPGATVGGGVAAPPAPNPQGWSDALAGLLNAASQAMAHGGGSGGWSGGGFGGGGGGGGGSGGFR